MVSIPCGQCAKLINSDADGRLPPWCPGCGSNLRPPSTTAQAPPVAPSAPVEGPAPASVPSFALPPEPRERPSEEYPADPPDYRLLPSEVPPPRLSPFAALCAAACALIPLFTLGGAIPAMIGASGMSACLALGRNPRIDPGPKASACVAIVVICWMGMFYIVGGIANLLRPALPG